MNDLGIAMNSVINRKKHDGHLSTLAHAVSPSHAAEDRPLVNSPLVDSTILADPCGRQVGYLRLSLTPACAMRCTYCRPKVINDLPDVKHMSPVNIENLVAHLVKRWGLKKVRLTGGEPTSRKDILEIVSRVACIDGIEDLAMTTNALSLPEQAAALKRAGLRRLNISLDSLNPQTFERMTGVKGPKRVIEGIDAAIEAGFSQPKEGRPLRLNTVVLAGENEGELPELVRFAADRGLEIRFIELMPMGPLADQWSHRFVDEARMKASIAPIVKNWELLEQGHSAARPFKVTLDDGKVTTIGFITPMSCNFCAACNRVRITAAGDVYPCLMDEPRGSIAPAMYPSFNAKHFDELMKTCLTHKAPEHPVNGFTQMTILGG